MARPSKIGLDYFPLDCDFFSNDLRIPLCLREAGAECILLYLYILCECYRGAGYYVDGGEGFTEIACLRLELEPAAFTRCLELLLRRGLLDERLWRERCVLTSRGIQSRYQAAVRARGRKNMIWVRDVLWLLQPDETEQHILPVLSESDALPGDGLRADDGGYEKTGVNS